MAGIEDKIKSLFIQHLGNSITPNQQLVLNEVLVQINQIIKKEPLSPLPLHILDWVQEKRVGVTTLLAFTAIALWEMYPTITIAIATSSHGASEVMSRLIRTWMQSEFRLDDHLNLYTSTKRIIFKVGMPDYYPLICSFENHSPIQ